MPAVVAGSWFCATLVGLLTGRRTGPQAVIHYQISGMWIGQGQVGATYNIEHRRILSCVLCGGTARTDSNQTISEITRIPSIRKDWVLYFHQGVTDLTGFEITSIFWMLNPVLVTKTGINQSDVMPEPHDHDGYETGNNDMRPPPPPHNLTNTQVAIRLAGNQYWTVQQ